MLPIIVSLLFVRCRCRRCLVALILIICSIHRLPRPVQQAVPTSIVSSTASLSNTTINIALIMNKQTAADNLTYSRGGDEAIIIDE